MILLIFVSIFNFYSASSVNWESITDEPCSATQYQTEWGSPIEFKLCMSALCDRCCYTLIYYDRWIGIPAINNEIFVAGLFHDGNSCCDEYSDEAVVEEFFKQLFYNKSIENNNYYNLVNPTEAEYVLSWFSVKGKCKINEEELCGTTCCSTPIKMYFTENNEIHTVTSITIGSIEKVTYPSCGPPQEDCQPDCSVHNKGIVPLLCPIPCDLGEWSSEKVETINVVECPECQIQFKYLTRTTSGCQPTEYNDYRILEWEKINCDECPLPNEADYLGTVISWLLYNGGLPLPTNGDCLYNYRVINSLCWQFVNNRAIYCDETKCCIKYYKICREWNTSIPDWQTRWYDITPPGQTEQCTPPCIKLCNPIPN